jgi:transcription termination factor Rho
MRKADLIEAILGGSPDGGSAAQSAAGEDDQDDAAGRVRPRRRRARRSAGAEGSEADGAEQAEPEVKAPAARRRAAAVADDEDGEGERAPRRSRSRGARSGSERPARGGEDDGETAESGRVAEGAVEVLGNGSAFLRVSPPEPSDDDVYISAAQVRRCELVTGDLVTGPVRTPRRSERYPSLVRIDTINGVPADAVSDGSRYEDLPVAWPSERIALDSDDPTVKAIEWLTPLGLGSRASIVGAAHAGKTETLRRIAQALGGRDDLEVSLVLIGARPEEIAQWGEGPLQPAAALSFAASAEAQGQAAERAIDTAKRVAARGGNAVVLIDSLDDLSAHTSRKILAAARNLHDGGSLTLIATAHAPLGGETTVIALDHALTSSGREPILDLPASGTLRPELLVGDDGADAIKKARATALEG